MRTKREIGCLMMAHCKRLAKRRDVQASAGATLTGYLVGSHIGIAALGGAIAGFWVLAPAAGAAAFFLVKNKTGSDATNIEKRSDRNLDT